MNVPFYIARTVAARNTGATFSRMIIRIATIAVALSVAIMLIATALIAGFKKEISDKIFGFWGHIHIVDNSVGRSVLEVAPISVEQDFYPYLDTIQRIRYRQSTGASVNNYVEKQTKGGINYIQVFALKPGIIKIKEEIEGIILKGIGPDFREEFIKEYLQEGQLFSVSDSSISRNIVISRQTADRLQLHVGDKFRVHFVTEKGQQLQRIFEVSGIFKTGLEEYDRRFALVDIRQIQRILGWQPNEVGGFEVFIDHIDDLEAITEYIYLEKLPSDLYAENIREKFPPIFEWLQLQDVNQYVIIGLMLIVGVINMATALLILIIERTNMIGTLKALGASDWSIQRIFLYYAGIIVLWGLFWGNLIGLGLIWLQDSFQLLKLSEEDYYLSYAPVHLNWWIVLAISLGTLLVVVFIMLIPSLLVKRINVVNALRFK